MCVLLLRVEGWTEKSLSLSLSLSQHTLTVIAIFFSTFYYPSPSVITPSLYLLPLSLPLPLSPCLPPLDPINTPVAVNVKKDTTKALLISEAWIREHDPICIWLSVR